MCEWQVGWSSGPFPHPITSGLCDTYGSSFFLAWVASPPTLTSWFCDHALLFLGSLPVTFSFLQRLLLLSLLSAGLLLRSLHGWACNCPCRSHLHLPRLLLARLSSSLGATQRLRRPCLPVPPRMQRWSLLCLRRTLVSRLSRAPLVLMCCQYVTVVSSVS